MEKTNTKGTWNGLGENIMNRERWLSTGSAIVSLASHRLPNTNFCIINVSRDGLIICGCSDGHGC